MARILVIEDDLAIAHAYELALVRAGHVVDLATDGEQGLKMYTPEHQVVLLDMLLPGYDGLDFLRHLNINGRPNAPKVIALSNIDTPQIITAAKEMGVSQYLLKVEYTPEQVVDIVAQQLGR